MLPNVIPPYTPFGIKVFETFITIVLLESRYSGQLLTNIRSIACGIGCTIAGDEKFYRSCPDVREVHMMPDRVGLRIYELCIKSTLALYVGFVAYNTQSLTSSIIPKKLRILKR